MTTDERVLAAFDPPPAEHVGIDLMARAKVWSDDIYDVCARLEAAGHVASREAAVEGASVPVRLYRLAERGLAERGGGS